MEADLIFKFSVVGLSIYSAVLTTIAMLWM